MDGPVKRVVMLILLFFFQAEDGIRDKLVTGVQTCALPISRPGTEVQTRLHRLLFASVEYETPMDLLRKKLRSQPPFQMQTSPDLRGGFGLRSEEHRVGKECRSGWGAEGGKKNRSKLKSRQK